MGDITFTKEEKETIVDRVKTYFSEELNQDIGGFDAEFLIDFFSRELGPYFYNQGLTDAHAIFSEKSDELNYLIEDLEKPIV